jgi:hypothetical protein
MKLHVISICLDAMPWIAYHLPVFNTLDLDWHWHVVEGVGRNILDTSWVKGIPPRLSIDGTTEYLDSIKSHKRVTIYRKPQWEGKVAMVNAPLMEIKEPGIVMQVDSDELWSKAQIEQIVYMFNAHPSRDMAQFKCRYYMGPDTVITSENTYGNHLDYEWYRAWRWAPGMLFEKHEPPVMQGTNGNKFSIAETVAEGLVFEHYAYATEEQVAFKERYYGYAGAVEQWNKLQANKVWPTSLKNFCKWVKDDAIVDKL